MNLINQGIIIRLLNILNDEQQPDNIRIESVIVLGSLAKSQDEHVISILSSGAIETLIRGRGQFEDTGTMYVVFQERCSHWQSGQSLNGQYPNASVTNFAST